MLSYIAHRIAQSADRLYIGSWFISLVKSFWWKNTSLQVVRKQARGICTLDY